MTPVLVGSEYISPEEFEAEVPPVGEEVARFASAFDWNVVKAMHDGHPPIPAMRWQGDLDTVGGGDHHPLNRIGSATCGQTWAAGALITSDLSKPQSGFLSAMGTFFSARHQATRMIPISRSY